MNILDRIQIATILGMVYTGIMTAINITVMIALKMYDDSAEITSIRTHISIYVLILIVLVYIYFALKAYNNNTSK